MVKWINIILIYTYKYFVCLFMGHTAKFAIELSTSSGIILKERLDCHDFVGTEI